MPLFLKITFASLIGLLATSAGLAQEEAKPEVEEKATEAPAIEQKAKEIRQRTTTYDVESIRELYQKLEKQKADAAKNAPDHLNTEDMDLLILKDRVVEGYKLRNERELMEKMNPDIERSINRIARLDPQLANELLVARRADEAFMAGERDAGRDGDAGRTANMSAAQIVAAFEKAQEATRKALGGKAKSDDADQ